MDESFERKQKNVQDASTRMFFLILSCYGASYFYQPTIFVPVARMSQLKWLIPVVFNYLLSIFAVVMHRAGSEHAIDGSAFSKETRELCVLRAILQNTLEQTVLLSFTHIIWILVIPDPFLCLQPVSVILFLLGRFMFVRGYKHSTRGRADGFSLSFLSSVVLIAIEMMWFIGSLFV